MYYVLIINYYIGYREEENRTESFHLENEVVYQNEEETYAVKNGQIEPNGITISERGLVVTDWDVYPVRDRKKVIIVRKDGIVETGYMFYDAVFTNDDDGKEEVINKLAPVRWVNLCPSTMSVMCDDYCLLVIGQSTSLMWFSKYGGYCSAKEILTPYPVTSGVEVDFYKISLTGPVSWKVHRHEKCSRGTRDFFRMLLLVLRDNFNLFYRVAGFI